MDNTVYMVVWNKGDHLAYLYSNERWYRWYVSSYGCHLKTWKRRSTAEKHARFYTRSGERIMGMSAEEIDWINEPFYQFNKVKRANYIFNGLPLDDELRAKHANEQKDY